MRRLLLATLIAAAFVAPIGRAGAAASCAPADHPGGDWTSYGGDYENTRSQPLESVIGPSNVATLQPAWVVSSEGLGGAGDITGTPVVVDGCLYIGTNRGWIFSLNADTGELVWKANSPGVINGSVAVDDTTVYVPFDFSSDTYMSAYDRVTGIRKWKSPRLDNQTGSDIFGSPVVYDGVVFIGISGLAEVEDESTRYGFQGSYVLLDARTGAILKKTWIIPESEWEAGNSGATIWSTPAIDTVEKVAYVGSGNPFDPEAEHERTNALLKVDMDRTSPTFGEILSSYKGTIDDYVPQELMEPQCVDIPEGVVEQGQGFVEATACGDLDLDIGASPNIMRTPEGRTVVGVGQKSGVYHLVDPVTMEREWESLVGFPSEVGGIVGSTAWDGTSIYGPHTVGGYLWSIDQADGAVRWLAPVADGVHWGEPVAVANGVVYTVDFKGFLDAYAADTGVPLLHLPMALGAHARFDSNPSDPILSWAGVSVARNTIYAGIGIDGEGYGIPQLPNGYVIAYRPGPPALPGL